MDSTTVSNTTTAVVVPNWNGIDVIEDCLISLQKQDTPVTIIVVDNGSTDGSRRFIEENFPDIVLLSQPRNLGFAGGVNIGIKYAVKKRFTYVGLFNSDAVAATSWLGTLMRVLEANPRAGIATGLLLHADGRTIDSTGDWYSIWGLPFPRGRGDKTGSAAPAGNVFSGSGGASLYRISLLERIGLFDEKFFAYYEDVDLSFRANLAGYNVAYEPLAIAYHERGAASSRIGSGSQTAITKVSGFTVYQTFKNLPVLFVKDVPGRLLFKIGVRFYPSYVLMLGNSVKNGNGLSALRGMLASIGLLPHALRERRRIQRERIVTPAYIMSLLWPDLPPDQSGIRKVRGIFTGKH